MIISIKWCTDDVLDDHSHLTIEQADKVLQALKDNHDAGIGINWEVISDTVESMYPIIQAEDLCPM